MKPLYRKMQGLFLYPDITLSSVFFPFSLLLSFFFVILLLSLQNKIGEKRCFLGKWATFISFFLSNIKWFFVILA